MDKLQQSAINGGYGHCICAYICSGCTCQSDGSQTMEAMEWADMDLSSDKISNDIKDPTNPV